VDKYLAAFIDEFGQTTSPHSAAPDVLEKFGGRLPSRLLEYWKELGFSGFSDGMFWITNPDDYESAIEEWIGDTPIMEEDAYYVIGRSGFGDLYLWGEKNGHKYTINPANGWILQRGEGRESQIDEGGADKAISVFFSVNDKFLCDVQGTTASSDRGPLFSHAVAKFGPLAHDEVFAFEPAPVLGGSERLDRIAKRNIHVYLSLLAQASEREILTPRALRKKAFG